MSPSPKLWHPLAFLLCHLLAAVLFSSWIYPPTRVYWDALDQQVFFSLNGMLAWGEPWPLIWAWANNRAMDIVFGVLMILFYLHLIFSGQQRQIMERMISFVLMCCIILISAEGLLEYLQGLLNFSRQSPTLVLEPAYRLSELAPLVKAKDASGNSFPGDHGTVVFIWLAFVWLYAGWGHRWAALLLALLILLPRLVGGGHWLSDNLVGSGTLVLLYMAWFVATPFAYLVRSIGEAVLGAILPWRTSRSIPRRASNPLP